LVARSLPGARGAALRARPQKEIAGNVKQLTRVRSPAKDVKSHWNGFRAVEGLMSTKNLWNNSVPRVELDQRARDARLRLDQIERLAVPPSAEMSSSFGRRSITPSTSSRFDGEGG